MPNVWDGLNRRIHISPCNGLHITCMYVLLSMKTELERGYRSAVLEQLLRHLPLHLLLFTIETVWGVN